MLSIRMIIRIRIYATWSLAPTDLYWDAVVCTPVTPPLGSCGATESFPSSPAQKCNFVLHEDDLWFVQGCMFFGWPQMQIDESWNSDQVSIVQTTSKAAPSVVPHRAIVLEEQNYTTPPYSYCPLFPSICRWCESVAWELAVSENFPLCGIMIPQLMAPAHASNARSNRFFVQTMPPLPQLGSPPPSLLDLR